MIDGTLCVDHDIRVKPRAMPTILRVGPYRFFFYAGDRNEMPHMHVERERFIAKFWLATSCWCEVAALTEMILMRISVSRI